MQAIFSRLSSGWFALCCIAAILGGTQAHANDAAIPQFIRERLAGSPPIAIAATPNERAVLAELYRSNSFNALWHQDGRLTQPAVTVLAELKLAENYGLRPDTYTQDLIHSADEMLLDPAAAAAVDITISAAAARFINHLHYGRIDPREAGFQLSAPRPALNLSTAVLNLAAAADIRATLESYEPQAIYYRLLKRQLALYRDLAARANLTLLPLLPARSITLDDEYAGAAALRELLVSVGDLDAAQVVHEPAATVLDAALIAAIQRFQRRHGLDPDGLLGKRTFAALTTPFRQRVRQIELTMERWRWLPPLRPPLIIINIPQFMLFAFPASPPPSPVLEIPVIVGRDTLRLRTPVLTSSITSVVFRPYWDVPGSITQRELLPLIQRNPRYLEEHHMQIVRVTSGGTEIFEPTAENLAALAAGTLRLRQQPGPDNALGPIKFVLPNSYDVYLHATPEAHLFEAARRAFSHGCIRVSDPITLAEYVLRYAPGEWNAATIEAGMCGSKTFTVQLTTPLPVMLLYGTAVATETHGMLFFEDIYGYDGKLEALLP